jgi:hypothetical protein
LPVCDCMKLVPGLPLHSGSVANGCAEVLRIPVPGHWFGRVASAGFRLASAAAARPSFAGYLTRRGCADSWPYHAPQLWLAHLNRATQELGAQYLLARAVTAAAALCSAGALWLHCWFCGCSQRAGSVIQLPQCACVWEVGAAAIVAC